MYNKLKWNGQMGKYVSGHKNNTWDRSHIISSFFFWFEIPSISASKFKQESNVEIKVTSVNLEPASCWRNIVNIVNDP